MKRSVLITLCILALLLTGVLGFMVGRTTLPPPPEHTTTGLLQTPADAGLSYEDAVTFTAEIAHIDGNEFLVNGLAINNINHRTSFVFTVTEKTKLLHHGMAIGVKDLQAGDLISVTYNGKAEDLTPANIGSPFSVELTVKRHDRTDADLSQKQLMYAAIRRMDGRWFLVEDTENGKEYQFTVPEDITPRDHGTVITLADFEVGDVVAIQYTGPVADTAPLRLYELTRFDLSTKKDLVSVLFEEEFIYAEITQTLDAYGCYYMAEGVDISGNDYRGSYHFSLTESLLDQKGLSLEVGNIVKIIHSGVGYPQRDGSILLPFVKDIEVHAPQMAVMEAQIVKKYASSLLLGKIDPEMGEAHGSAYVSVGNVILHGDKEITVDDLAIGDRVAVYYDGWILETYPVQIRSVFKIVLLDDEPSA